jgi:hypothetical protein
MKQIWISTPKTTGLVDVIEADIIIATPPIWKRFIGQSLCNLINWLKKTGQQPIATKEIDNGKKEYGFFCL